MLGDFNAKLGREDIFKPKTGTEILHRDNNHSSVRIVNFVTSKNLVLKSTMFLHRNIQKYAWTSPYRKTHSQIDHILIDRRWHSSILDVRPSRGSDCNTYHYVMVAKFRETLATHKQAAQKSDVERFNLRKLS
jgi:ribosomal protein L24E